MKINPDNQTMSVKDYREKLCMTQKQFAELLNVTVSTVQNWESARRRPHASIFNLLEIYLKKHKRKSEEN